MRRARILTATAGLAAGVLLAVLLTAPHIVTVSPSGISPSAWEPVTITFSRPLAPTPVPDHFRLEPPVAGEARLDGERLLFSPSEPLAYGQRYRARLAGGLRPASGLMPLWLGRTWEFTVGPPRLLYLRPVDGVDNVWLHSPNGPAEALTAEPEGVWDYEVASDGRSILVAAHDGRGLDLVRYGLDGRRELLLDCAEAACRNPRAQPRGSLIAYERAAAESSPAEVWLLDTATGADRPAHEPELLEPLGVASLSSHSPRWSGDGRYLAYFKPDARLIIIVDLAAEEEPRLLPANLELMGDWSPTGYQLAYSELAFGETEPHAHVDESGQEIPHEESGLFTHLVITDLVSGETVDLSAGQEVNDGRPVWSPDGRELALSRTETGSGRQLWRVAVDGSDARALTDDPFLNYTAITWSPDGRRLAFMRQEVATPGGPPAVWLIDLETGVEEQVAAAAFWPAWLP